METYQTTKKNVSRYELQAELPKMKKGGQPWLSEVGSLSIQSKSFLWKAPYRRTD